MELRQSLEYNTQDKNKIHHTGPGAKGERTGNAQMSDLNRDMDMALLVPPKEERITYKSKIQIQLMVLNLALSTFYFGYVVVYFGQLDTPTMLDILDFHGLNVNIANGLLNGCVPVGAPFGAFLSSILLKQFSRRRCLLLINVFAFIVGGLIYIQNFYSLLFFRFCQGLCVGMYSSITPLIINQLAPTEISGSLGSYTQLNVSFGVVFACIFAYALKMITGDLTGSSWWYYTYGVTQISIVFQSIMLLFVFPYETPKYLLQVGKEEQAKELIEIIYKPEFIEQVLQVKKAYLRAIQAKESLVTEIDEPLKDWTIGAVKVVPQASNFVNKIPIIVAVNLAILQQVSGINAITVYAGNIAANVTSGQLSLLMPTIVNFQSFLGTFISGLLLAKFGRKTIIQVGTFFEGLANILVALGFFLWYDAQDTEAGEALVLSGLFIYMAFFGVSLGPVVWLYIPEIVEGKVVPYTTAVNWTCASLVIILFPILTNNVFGSNPAPLFLFFAFWCVVSFIFNLKFMIETKDKPQTIIKEEYDRLKMC